MEDRKYILTDETKEVDGHILHRIQAVRDFGIVKAGDLGGWIERKWNLSQEENCWVFDEACVFENATVRDSACVRDHVQVYESAFIRMEAIILGSTEVHHFVTISSKAKIYRGDITKESQYLVIGPIGSRDDYTTFFLDEYWKIWVACGCFEGDIDEFKQAVYSTHKGRKYKNDYLDAIHMAKKYFNRYKREETKYKSDYLDVVHMATKYFKQFKQYSL